jgi:hypothetical protein
MRRVAQVSAALWLVCGALACGSSGGQPGLYEYDWQALIPGPGEDGFDADLAAVARMRDRQFHVFHALPTGLNAEISIDRAKTTERQAIEDFLRQDDGWDFEGFSGLRTEEIVDGWWKVAGAYAGMGVAADAFRYGTLRDQHYPAEQIDRAREQLLTGLDGLARAIEITGVEGVIARGFASRVYAGGGQTEQTTPLFDLSGDPLPPEKTNGTWREDNSGLHPDFVWEDSCSRDMLIGWVTGMGAAWEVIELDAAIGEQVKERLRAQASQLVRAYMRVGPSGYDLEIPDADGRLTFHGYLNENNVDRMYLDGARNGFYAIMALGIIGALADIVDDPAVDAYLDETLIEQRGLAVIAKENSLLINFDAMTNFSNYNMAFQGAWLALRHIRPSQARRDLQIALDHELYDTPGYDFQPVEFSHAFFDLTWAAGMCGAAAGQACQKAPDQAAIDRGLQTLREFPAPPFFEFERVNCDEDELAAGVCLAEDGQTELTVLGEVGRNGDLIVAEPLPMRLRPPSNYYWRSNPYRPNGGAQGAGMFAGPDFRIGYWMGRWVRR